MTVLPYLGSIRPTLGPKTANVVADRFGNHHALHRVTGTHCPVCDGSLLMNLGEVTEEPDGSARFTCMRCHAPLRCNRQNFVFLDAE